MLLLIGGMGTVPPIEIRIEAKFKVFDRYWDDRSQWRIQEFTLRGPFNHDKRSSASL